MQASCEPQYNRKWHFLYHVHMWFVNKTELLLFYLVKYCVMWDPRSPWFNVQTTDCLMLLTFKTNIITHAGIKKTQKQIMGQ